MSHSVGCNGENVKSTVTAPLTAAATIKRLFLAARCGYQLNAASIQEMFFKLPTSDLSILIYHLKLANSPLGHVSKIESLIYTHQVHYQDPNTQKSKLNPRDILTLKN